MSCFYFLFPVSTCSSKHGKSVSTLTEKTTTIIWSEILVLLQDHLTPTTLILVLQWSGLGLVIFGLILDKFPVKYVTFVKDILGKLTYLHR